MKIKKPLGHIFVVLLLSVSVFSTPAEASEGEEPAPYATGTIAAQSSVGFITGSATMLAGVGWMIGSAALNDEDGVMAGGVFAIAAPLITIPAAVNVTGWLMGHEYRHLGAHLGALAIGLPSAAGLYFLTTRTDFENPLALIAIYSLTTTIGSVVGYHIQADQALNPQSPGSTESALHLPLMQWQMQF